ncbi:MAG: hypothetical protein ABIS50_06795 [Luteolibacter sp.]|uniref:hypothetical protein n=1 Tax=Luteolibacter sp. TaxID=1962973 RepID=UPI003267D2ED
MNLSRQILTLVIGLAVGVAGAVLFLQSMPPKEGSAEEQVLKLEAKLKSANNRLTALEAADPHGRRKPGRTLADGARRIAEDLRDGKPVTPDDVLHAFQPFIRDFSPIFERMRAKEQQRKVDAMAGELARKYSLTPVQQESLKKWLDQKAVDDSKRYTNLLASEGTKLEDIGKGAYEFRLDDGLEQFMGNTLSGDKLATFKSDRMLEKVGKVQEEADMKVSRLDAIVGLDEAQRGQVFGVMARGSRDFDPTMQFEELGTDAGALTSGQSKQQAILSVLTPAQREAYQTQRESQRAAAQKEMESIGLTLPDNWSNFDQLDF